MYKCPECKSPRVGEKIQNPQGKKIITLTYQNGCKMVIKSIAGQWSVDVIECHGFLKRK